LAIEGAYLVVDAFGGREKKYVSIFRIMTLAKNCRQIFGLQELIRKILWNKELRLSFREQTVACRRNCGG
jgi:hypothetical protein